MLWFWFDSWFVLGIEVIILGAVWCTYANYLERKVTEERRNSKHPFVSPPPPPPRRRKRIVRTDFGFHEEWTNPPQGGTGAVEPLTQRSTAKDYQAFKNIREAEIILDNVVIPRNNGDWIIRTITTEVPTK